MDKMFSKGTAAADGRLVIASVAGVYAPLILILAAALVLF